MSAEAERGCGFRQPGGLYLVGGGASVPCDRLPVPLEPCACCGWAPGQLRSHAWIPGKFLGDHRLPQYREGNEKHGEDPYARIPNGRTYPCPDHKLGERFGLRGSDPICVPDDEPRLLMWVGVRFYSAESFTAEASALGISKRISEIPKGLVLGRTWVLFAHPEATYEPVSWAFNWLYGDGEVQRAPGIFHGFVPQAVELILHETEATAERIEKESARGVRVVIIPDGAKDARISWRPGEPRPEIPPAPAQVPLNAEGAGSEGTDTPHVEAPAPSATTAPAEPGAISDDVEEGPD
jgi:hypothetical protein